MSSAIVLNLNHLTTDIPALTGSYAGYIREAIVMCFNHHAHDSGVFCVIRDFDAMLATARIVWSTEYSGRIGRAFGALAKAAELAGEGIAFLTILNLTEYTIIERSHVGSGVDFWLGYKDEATASIFRRAARLEVKGRTELPSAGAIRQVARQAVEQTRQSDHTRLPAYIIVSEFSRPIVYMVQR